MHNVLTYNKIWKQRIINIGVINSETCENFNLTGVMARSAGIKKDLRLSAHDVYSSYNSISFKSYLGINGDCFDRYLIRMLEMGESLHISNICIDKLLSCSNYTNATSTTIWNQVYSKKSNNNTYSTMEDLINHFLHWHTGLKITKNINVAYIEAPKGEFGVTLVSNNTTKPHKCKVKSPSYYNLQALPELTKGHYLADIAALIGTIDIVFGEVDR
jgi:NADH-quinone oxidoreductase subunit D